MRPRRRRHWSPLNTFYVLVVLGLMVGGSLWLDYGSEPVIATVTGKTEEIRFSFAPRAVWYRSYGVGVEFSTHDGRSGSATVHLPQDRYDALERGHTIRIRYLAAFPLFARSTDRSTITVLRDLGVRVMTDQVLAPLLLWFGVGLIVLWVASRLGTGAIVVGGLVWIAAAFPLLFPSRAPPLRPPEETHGRIAAISLVDRAPERRGKNRRRSRGPDLFLRLDVPYQIVQFRLPAPGRSDSVLAVDAVDSGSTPGLAHGAIVPVRYDRRFPREAQLAQGTRTFIERNRFHLVIPIVGGGLLVMLVATGWRARRTRRRSSDPSS